MLLKSQFNPHPAEIVLHNRAVVLLGAPVLQKLQQLDDLRAPRCAALRLTALAMEAFGPDMALFKTGRDFAAWLGLVPTQHSSGGKERLGRMLARKPKMLVAIALAHKMARQIWAMLTENEDNRDPARAVAA